MALASVPSDEETRATLRALRLTFGFDRGQLAGMLYTPVSTLRDWELHYRTPPPMARQRIGELYRELSEARAIR